MSASAGECHGQGGTLGLRGPRAGSSVLGGRGWQPRPGVSPEPGLGLSTPLFLSVLEPDAASLWPLPGEGAPLGLLGSPTLRRGVRSDVQDTLFSISEERSDGWEGRGGSKGGLGARCGIHT